VIRLHHHRGPGGGFARPDSFVGNRSFTLGYAYERWRYNDAAYDGYQYTIPSPGVTTNTSQSYLNGYLAFTNYNANVVYLLATYKFAPH